MLCIYMMSVILAGYLTVKLKIQLTKEIKILDIFPILILSIISPIGIGMWINENGTNITIWKKKDEN